MNLQKDGMRQAESSERILTTVVGVGFAWESKRQSPKRG
jgi:hypothetical protein